MLSHKHTNFIPWINCGKSLPWPADNRVYFQRKENTMNFFGLSSKNVNISCQVTKLCHLKTGRASYPREKLLTSCHQDSSFRSLSPLPNSRRSCMQAVIQSWVAMCQLFSTPRMRQQHFVCRMRWDKEFLFGISNDAVSCQDCIAPEMDDWICEQYKTIFPTNAPFIKT